MAITEQAWRGATAAQRQALVVGLDDFTRDISDMALEAGGVVSLKRHGAKAGVDISRAVDSAMKEAEELKANVLLPPLDGAWFIEAPIVPRNGVKLVGAGFLRRPGNVKGSVIRRLGNFPLFEMPVFDGGISGNMGAEGLYLDGNGYNSPVMSLQKTGNFHLSGCGLAGSGTAPLLRLFNQVQDSSFSFNYFEQASPVDSGVVEIDDTLGVQSDHNQNLVFFTNTWEAYRGPAVKIHGKGVGPGNSLIDFIRSKMEGLNSNAPHFSAEDASQLNFDYSLIAGRGTAGDAVTALFRLKNCSRSSVRQARVAWNSGGASLANLAQLDGCSGIDLDFVPSFAATVDGLTGAGLVQHVGAASINTNVTSTYTGAKALLTQGAMPLPVLAKHYKGCATRGDGSITLNVMSDRPTQVFTTPLSQARTVTVSPSGARDGDRFRIVRAGSATGAYHLSVGALKSLASAGTWCEVEFDGASWVLTASGAL